MTIPPTAPLNRAKDDTNRFVVTSMEASPHLNGPMDTVLTLVGTGDLDFMARSRGEVMLVRPPPRTSDAGATFDDPPQPPPPPPTESDNQFAKDCFTLFGFIAYAIAVWWFASSV